MAEVFVTVAWYSEFLKEMKGTIFCNKLSSEDGEQIRGMEIYTEGQYCERIFYPVVITVTGVYTSHL